MAAIDLGGGSVQQAYALTDFEAAAAPDGYVTKLSGGGRAYSVYVHRCAAWQGGAEGCDVHHWVKYKWRSRLGHTAGNTPFWPSYLPHSIAPHSCTVGLMISTLYKTQPGSRTLAPACCAPAQLPGLWTDGGARGGAGVGGDAGGQPVHPGRPQRHVRVRRRGARADQPPGRRQLRHLLQAHHHGAKAGDRLRRAAGARPTMCLRQEGWRTRCSGSKHTSAVRRSPGSAPAQRSSTWCPSWALPAARRRAVAGTCTMCGAIALLFPGHMTSRRVTGHHMLKGWHCDAIAATAHPTCPAWSCMTRPGMRMLRLCEPHPSM